MAGAIGALVNGEGDFGVVNELLRRRRESVLSPSGSGRVLSRTELADAVNEYVWSTTGRRVSLNADTISRYERGMISWPGADCRDGLRAVLGVSTDAELGFRPTPRGRAGAALARLTETDPSSTGPGERELLEMMRVVEAGVSEGSPVNWPARSIGETSSEVMAAAVLSAAHQTWKHLQATSVTLDPMGIRSMHDQIRTLARSDVSPGAMLVEAARTRDAAYQMLEGTKSPAQQVDLYLAAGMSCALLADASFDLDQPRAALAQTQAAARYADMAGHAGLRAWAIGYGALLAYWDGRASDAVNIIEGALASVPDGVPTARIQSIRARAWALVGDKEKVTTAIRMADEALTVDSNEMLHDEIGGVLGWLQDRHDRCAGTALVTVGAPHEASIRLRTVVDRDDAPAHVTDLARADLAAACLEGGDFDAAAEALEPVWAMPTERRRFGLTSRLDALVPSLASQRWDGHRPATTLSEQIHAFASEAAEYRALVAGEEQTKRR